MTLAPGSGGTAQPQEPAVAGFVAQQLNNWVGGKPQAPERSIAVRLLESSHGIVFLIQADKNKGGRIGIGVFIFRARARDGVENGIRPFRLTMQRERISNNAAQNWMQPGIGSQLFDPRKVCLRLAGVN